MKHNDVTTEYSDDSITLKADASDPGDLAQAEDLASDIMELSRNRLLIYLRFLETALFQLNPVPDPETTLSTDGWFLYYGSMHVLKTYQMDPGAMCRDYLHSILHCLFHHPFVSTKIDSVKWDLACDIAVEATISELSIDMLNVGRTLQQDELLTLLRSNLNSLTAENIYVYLSEADIPFETLLTLRQAFFADQHEPWYEHSQSEDKNDKDDSEEDSSDDSSGNTGNESATENSSDDSEDKDDAVSSNKGNDSGDDNDAVEQQVLAQLKNNQLDELEETWEDISNHITADLESYSSKYGEKAGTLLAGLKQLQKDDSNYEEFLRRFSVYDEETKLNPDEFDYIYYTYGLSLYERVPLIEPLEYTEVKKIKEFVIAIDTSGSVSGSLVNAFLKKTYSILGQNDSFFEETRIYIIECDSEIQNVTCIHNSDELESYFNNHQYKGMGGTDFRPVFDYVRKLQENGELMELRGLLYFTDGDGEYPQLPPPYETAFVLIDPDVLRNYASDNLFYVTSTSQNQSSNDSGNNRSIRRAENNGTPFGDSFPRRHPNEGKNGFGSGNDNFIPLDPQKVHIPVWAIKVILGRDDLFIDE